MRKWGLLTGKAGIVGGIIFFLYLYGNLVLQHVLGKTGSVQTLLPVLLDFFTLVAATEVFLIISRFMVSKYLENRGKKKEIKVILSLYTYLVWSIIGVFLLTTIFKDVGALLTSIGLIGFGITFALQKPILNFVGWLMIVLTKPFNINDRIEVAGIRGDVLSLNIMYTRVQGTRPDAQTKSEQIITIPNELVLTNPVMNYSRMGDVYSDELTFSITYESNWRKAMHIIEAVTMSATAKYLNAKPPATIAEKRSWQEAITIIQEASKKFRKGIARESVQEKISLLKSAEAGEPRSPKPRILMQFGASSIDLNVLYQTDLHNVRNTKHDITRAFMEEIEKHDDIELACPYMQIVHGEKARKYFPRQRKLFVHEPAPPDN